MERKTSSEKDNSSTLQERPTQLLAIKPLPLKSLRSVNSIFTTRTSMAKFEHFLVLLHAREFRDARGIDE